MTKILSRIGFILALGSTVLSVTTYSNFAIIPIITAFVIGLSLLLKSRGKPQKPKTIQYIFLLVIISIYFVVYNSFLPNVERNDLEKPKKESDTTEMSTSNRPKQKHSKVKTVF